MTENKGTRVCLMKWNFPGNTETNNKILFLKEYSLEPWKPYNQCSSLKQPDTILKGVQTSKGFRTAQVLLQKRWKYV